MYWVATYKDGTNLSSKSGGKYKDIRRDDLERFSLISEGAAPVTPIYTLWLDPDQRLIYRRRVFTNGTEEHEFYLIGWQQTIEGRNVQSILYIDGSGMRVNLAGRFREDHPLFYAVELYPEELDVHDLG